MAGPDDLRDSEDMADDVMQRLVDLGLAEHVVRVSPTTGLKSRGILITKRGKDMAASLSPREIARLINSEKPDA